MILECCHTPFLILGCDPPPCPECQNPLQEPLRTLKEPDRPLEVPSWQDDALEDSEDAIWAFGSDSTAIPDALRCGSELGISFVTRQAVWEPKDRPAENSRKCGGVLGIITKTVPARRMSIATRCLSAAIFLLASPHGLQ